jgi:CheY-like chemotaxis protein
MMHFDQRPATILVIDHEAEVLDRMARLLQGAHYLCLLAGDASAAFAFVNSARPDLIISEINVLGQSGVRLCEQLKQHAGMSETPLMFLSAAQTPDVIRRADTAGGTYYLRKPFDPQVVLELVDKALGMSHNGSQLASA